jgi:hypothetical protein
MVAFCAAFQAFQSDFSPRGPASVSDDRAQAATVMTQVDSIYKQALVTDAALANRYTAYDMAWQSNYDARMGFMAANPNSMMYPGNPYDTNNWQALTLRGEGVRNRQHNLTYAGLQMMVLLRTNRSILSRKQENEILMKYMDLSNRMVSSNSLGVTTDPVLLTASNTSMLGYQQQFAYNQFAPRQDIPVGGYNMSYWQSPDTVIIPIDGTTAQ